MLVINFFRNRSWFSYFVSSCVLLISLRAFGAEDGWVTSEVHAPRLGQYFFRSERVGKEVSYHVYLPLSYQSQPARRYPVIYWLHGTGGGIKELPRLATYFDMAMRMGKMPEAVIIIPNGMRNSMWSDSRDGRVPMETVLIRELLPEAELRFRIVASRDARVVEGFSMGGYGAARLGFKYPELFGAVSILGAGPMQRELLADEGPADRKADRAAVLREVYGSDQAYFKRLSPWVIVQQQADAIRGHSLIRIAVGERDTTRKPSEDFSAHLKQLDIHHDLFVAPRIGHNPIATFEAMGDSNWDFYRKAWALVLARDNLGSQRPWKTYSDYLQNQGELRRLPVVQRLLSFDRDGDGEVLIEDVPPPGRAAFRWFDITGDGVLRENELSR